MNNEALSKVVSDQANRENPVLGRVARILNLGLDLHYRHVTVAMQEDGGRIKAAGKMSHELFSELGAEKVERRLTDFQLSRSRSRRLLVTSRAGEDGSQNLVVVPKAMGQGGKKQT